MANEWIYSVGKACYDSDTPGFTLTQEDLMTVGKAYTIKISTSNMTQGKLVIQGFEDYLEITEDGDHVFLSVATYTDLIINPQIYGEGVFDGCIDDVEVSLVPLYVIKDSNDDIVFTLIDFTGVSVDRDFVQYIIDWTEFEDGCYYIEFSDLTTVYRSDCFAVKLLHGCTLLLTWTNNEDGMGFDYSGLSFIQSMRIEGKLWKWKHTTVDKQTFRYSNGDEKILYARVYEEETLTISKMPKYMGQAFALALNHDTFEVEGIPYLFFDEDVTPTHRNTTETPPVEVVLRKKGQNLLNNNCG